MSDELMGGLIQMNANMVKPSWSIASVFIGAFGFLFVLLILCICIETMKAKHKKIRFGMIFGLAIPMVISLAIFLMGLTEPRVKEIHVCASGPVSIEQIAARYNIIYMNGKELILRER